MTICIPNTFPAPAKSSIDTTVIHTSYIIPIIRTVHCNKQTYFGQLIKSFIGNDDDTVNERAAFGLILPKVVGSILGVGSLIKSKHHTFIIYNNMFCKCVYLPYPKSETDWNSAFKASMHKGMCRVDGPTMKLHTGNLVGVDPSTNKHMSTGYILVTYKNNKLYIHEPVPPSSIPVCKPFIMKNY